MEKYLLKKEILKIEIGKISLRSAAAIHQPADCGCLSQGAILRQQSG